MTALPTEPQQLPNDHTVCVYGNEALTRAENNSILLRAQTRGVTAIFLINSQALVLLLLSTTETSNAEMPIRATKRLKFARERATAARKMNTNCTLIRDSLVKYTLAMSSLQLPNEQARI